MNTREAGNIKFDLSMLEVNQKRSDDTSASSRSSYTITCQSYFCEKTNPWNPPSAGQLLTWFNVIFCRAFR